MDSLTSQLDLSKLLIFHSALSLFTSLSISPPYNLPLALYGLLSLDGASQGGDGIRNFAYLWAASVGLDIFWLISWREEYGGFFVSLVILNLLLKPITVLSSLSRSSGGAFQLPTSMPGGFPTSIPSFGVGRGAGRAGGGRNGAGVPYQNFDADSEEELPVPTPKANANPNANSNSNVQAPKSPVPQPSQGGYHTLE
ncbi:hypothetical protein BT69DRAFT_290859 [Atractiella rhizophila]|nr:hypothetical protein BT69DRAFT_290859 [Atractiella rhizophila]